MRQLTTPSRPRSRSRQAGLTLIEFMVSIVIGMLMIAALATLIANQSATRGEIDRSGRMIENGRYALQTIATDVQMAGYWGEQATQPAVPGALPNPCSVTVADLEAAMGVHVQGYDSPATLPTALAACVTEHKPGTDVLVVRRVDPDTSATETAGETDLAKAVTGQVYLQTGLDASGAQMAFKLAAGADTATNATNFSLTKKDKIKLAQLRKVMIDIYYVSKCSVQVSGSCTAGDAGRPIPTLKRLELGVAAGVPALSNAVTLAEGIENLQVDYGVDSNGDGAPDGADVNGSAFVLADWANVMTVKINLLARSSETSAGYQDEKSYVLGATGGTVAAANDGYRRHVFVQSVRLVNPAARRAL